MIGALFFKTFFVAIVGMVVGTVFYYSSAKHKPIVEYSAKDNIVIVDDKKEEISSESGVSLESVESTITKNDKSKLDPEKEIIKENTIIEVSVAPEVNVIPFAQAVNVPPPPLYYQIPAVQNQAAVVRRRGGGGANTVTASLPNFIVTVSDNDDDNTVTPGQSITYTISINNSGGTSGSTAMTSAIPSDMGTPDSITYNNNCGDSPSSSFSAPTLSISPITISAGGTCTITFIISVDTPLNESTTLILEVDVGAPSEGGSDPANVSASTLTVNATPSLTVTSAEDDADNTVERSQDITYTLTIENSGDGAATVDVTDTITGDASDVGTFGFSGCGSSYTNSSSGASVNITNLAITVSTDCVITYHVTIDSDADHASTITNSADITVADEGGNDPSATNASTLTVDVTLVPYWQDGASVGNLTSTSDWQEISGITNPTLSANAGYLWLQSDGSIDKIFAVSTSTAASAGEWTLSGIDGSDYEDLSSARVSSQSYIYLADFGDNSNARSTIIIYRIKEPTITGSDDTVSAGDIETITAEYPAGSLPSHKDAEALLVDPDTGDMYIITKREAVAGVYYLAHASSYSGTQTLTDLGNMYDIPDVASVAATGNVVGGNISPNGREILIKSYNIMYLFSRDKSTQTIIQALQSTPTEVTGYVGGGSTTYRKSHPSQEPQGEAVTYDYNGDHYYTASEFVSTEGSTSTRFPLFKYTRLTGTPTTITLQEGVSPTAGYAGTIDTYIWDTTADTTRGTETTIIADPAVGVETDQRKGLLKFDVSSIPSDATIVGARLDLYVSTEGQGWKIHRMLVDWNENSTYNTLTAGVNDDDTDASTVEDNRNGVTLNAITGSIVNNMRMATIQGWVDGTYSNYGWLIEATDIASGDGQQYVSSEGVTTTQRPKLVIRYITP
ncbi:MAG TPA: DNRLRE domain-containing protein [Candidatus Paceibacterota bacterium]